MPFGRKSSLQRIATLVGAISLFGALAPAAGDALESTVLPLPACIDQPDVIAKIIDVQKQFPKTPQKYDGYRETFRDISNIELLSRLVYAETVATNCAAFDLRVAPMIAESIVARIRIRKGDVRGVVFQRDQYSSSLNIYPESRYREFLCPRQPELWKAAVADVEALLAEPPKPLVLPGDSAHYYLYKHSDRHKVPTWASDQSEWAVAQFPGSQELKPCIQFFRNPRWR